MRYANGYSRRAFLCSGAASLAAALLPGPSRAQEAATPARRRVLFLGFDGVEPKIVDEMIAAGRLPNLAALAESGTYARLGTTLPPQSPVAWASFATCTLPGEHGVYDFMTRDPRTYKPLVGHGSTLKPQLGENGEETIPAAFMTRRKGRTFWDVADEQGVRAKVLNVPFITPPDELEHGRVLCSLGVSDIRHASSFSFNLTDQVRQPAKAPGGVYLPMFFDGNVGHADVPAIQDMWLLDPGSASWVELSVRAVVDRKNKVATIQASNKTMRLHEGEWSDWFESEFVISPEYSVHAISRFHLMEAGEKFSLYLTSFQYHPEKPYLAFSTPPEYTAELKKRYGLFKTLGWAFDTHAVRQDRLSEEGFLADIRETMTWRERLSLDEIRQGNFDLFISVWTATDRVAHLFWRFRDKEHLAYDAAGARKYGGVIEEMYERMDVIVGKVRAELTGEDALFVLSDHGFGSFRIGFSVNTWLVRNGYASVIGQRNRATASGTRGRLKDFDWPRTRAYALGLSSLFLNIRGRERNGVVPASRVNALRREIRDKLLDVVCPDTNEHIFANVYIKGEYEGTSIRNAADLVLAYREPYQSSKPTFNGGIPPQVFINTTDKWSGEHAGSDPKNTPGILFCNKKLNGEDPHLIDLGVTALKYLGKEIPEAFEGKSLL